MQNELKKDRPVARVIIIIIIIFKDSHRTVVYNGKMYVFGGDRHKMPFNDLFELDFE
jgi:hypothetical protein